MTERIDLGDELVDYNSRPRPQVRAFDAHWNEVPPPWVVITPNDDDPTGTTLTTIPAVKP